MADENEQLGNEPETPITRRDLFTAAALAGLLANGEKNAVEAITSAIAYADSVVAALDGHKGGEAES